jgi:trk system potassium uptake protein TrkH
MVGSLTLLSIIHVLAPGGFGGLPAGDRRVITGNASNMTIDLGDFREVLGQYILITFVIFIGLMLAGVSGPYSAMLSMVVIATGGFLPFEGALENHAGPMAQLVLTIGLMIGTISVFWRRRLLRTPAQFFSANPEVIVIGIVILGVAVLYAARLSAVSGGAELGPIFVESLLASTSLVATSGIESRPGVIALWPDIVVLMIILVGGGIYSTTGGFKVYRVAAMAVHSARELNQLIYPQQRHQPAFWPSGHQRKQHAGDLDLFLVVAAHRRLQRNGADLRGDGLRRRSYHGDRVLFQCRAGL